MNDYPKVPRDLVQRIEQRKRTSLRAIAEYYDLRAKRQTSPHKRQHLAKAAEHYRRLAKLEEEVAATRPKPPASSA